MTSAVVNRAIRSLVWPLLKERGFSSFTSRTAWRDRGGFVDVVNFQSFNRYNADVLGCTTFSFAINLSIYFACVPSDHPPALRGGRVRPSEYEGHVRRRVYPRQAQLPGAPDVWLVDPDGVNIETTVSLAALAVAETSDRWFPLFANERAALSILQGLEDVPDEATRLPGAPGSAARNVSAGYLALAAGDTSTAAAFLRRALGQYQEFDAQNIKISRRFESMVPRHLGRTVSALSAESA